MSDGRDGARPAPGPLVGGGRLRGGAVKQGDGALPSAMCPPRPGSPPSGRSTLTTSAPKSAIIIVAVGPFCSGNATVSQAGQRGQGGGVATDGVRVMAAARHLILGEVEDLDAEQGAGCAGRDVAHDLAGRCTSGTTL